MDRPEQDLDDLVMAMPRRELFSISGFTADVELRVLESLAEECWFAHPQVLHEDIDAKEVRLGLVARRGGDWLLSDEGVLLHATSIPPAVVELGDGLSALRNLARLAGRELLGGQPRGVQLIGYLNDDGLPEIRPYFILVYLLQAAEDGAAPDGMRWLPRAALSQQALEPVSVLVVDGLPG